jgi:hypothetical protein
VPKCVIKIHFGQEFLACRLRMKRGIGGLDQTRKVLPRRSKTEGRPSEKGVPFLSVYWGDTSASSRAQDAEIETDVSHLRAQFIEKSLHRVSELLTGVQGCDNLQQALDICRKCTQYYYWHKPCRDWHRPIPGQCSPDHYSQCSVSYSSALIQKIVLTYKCAASLFYEVRSVAAARQPKPAI